jgi:hypothetical protein
MDALYENICRQRRRIEFTAKKLLGRLKRLKYNWKGVHKTNSFNDQHIKRMKRID